MITVSGLYFLLPTLLVIFVSFLVVRAAAIVLMMTGLDPKRARFQALSAFTGTGFTTREAETVINNPRRRRIIMWLMIMGNAGIVTVMVSATSSLVSSKGFQLPITLVLLAAGIVVIYKVATHKGFIRTWEGFVEDKFVKSGASEEEVAEDLLHLVEGYGLVRWIIKDTSSVVGQTLADCQFTQANVLVLGIERGKTWVPVPSANEQIEPGDKVVVYGPLDALRTLFKGQWDCVADFGESLPSKRGRGKGRGTSKRG